MSTQRSGPRSISDNQAGACTLLLALFPGGIALALIYGVDPAMSLIVGLTVFGAVFATNSAAHSYLILAYSVQDKVLMDVDFCYMANAAGWLTGSVLSGWVYQSFELPEVPAEVVTATASPT